MALASIANEPVIDRQALDRNTMGNESLQRELFMLYFDQAPVYIDQLEEALASGDTDAWYQAAHGIKGASRALGFLKLAAISRECQDVAPNPAIIEELRAAVQETRDGIGQVEAA